MKVFILTFLVTILTTGCTSANNQNSNTESVNINESINTPTLDIEENTANQIPLSSGIFELTEEEMDIYTRFKEELSTSVFENVSPFSIARIHIQAGLDGNWEAEYMMFSEVDRAQTLEEWEAFFEEQMTYVDQDMLINMVNDMFSLIQEGSFEEISDTEAHIIFQSVHGETLIFRFIRNNQGILEVRYSPIDYI